MPHMTEYGPSGFDWSELGKPADSISREQALANYYNAERRAGACPLVACERMAEFAKRLDRMESPR